MGRLLRRDYQFLHYHAAMLLNVIVKIGTCAEKQPTCRFCVLVAFLKFARSGSSVQNGYHIPINSECRKIPLPQGLLFRTPGCR